MESEDRSRAEGRRGGEREEDGPQGVNLIL